MTGNFDRQAIGRVAAILEVADRYSGNEIDDALAAARRAIVCSLKKPALTSTLSGRFWRRST